MAPNIVLVTVDSLRADRCSFLGYDEETTPALDALAAEGLVYENAIAPGPTTPESVPPTFTGEFPVEPIGEHGDRLRTAQGRLRTHMQSRDTLPERLARMGYTTAAFTPNPWTSRYFGFDAGFDHFQDYMASDWSSSIWRRMLEGRNLGVLKPLRLVMSWVQRENVFKPWPALYDEIIDWTRNSPEPYFLWVFLLDAHFPYLPSREYRSQGRLAEYEANLRLYLESQQTPYPDRVHRSLETAYDDALRYTDAFFERLTADLNDDVAYVVHGDHGDAFGEHGSYTHQHELYEENIHVPLVVTGAGSGRINEPVSLRSVPEIVGGLASDGSVPPVETLFATSKARAGRKLALRGDRVKYIDDGESRLLYDLAADESTPVENEELEQLCQRLVDQARETESELGRVKGAAEAGIDGA